MTPHRSEGCMWLVARVFVVAAVMPIDAGGKHRDMPSIRATDASNSTGGGDATGSGRI